MIQRIQTVYLLIVSVLMIFTCCTSLAQLSTNGDEYYVLDTFGVHSVGEKADLIYSTWPLFVILAIVALTSMISIFLYRNRVLQYRISNFNTLLISGYYLSLAAYYYFITKNIQVEFSFHWGAVLPLIALVINYLASRSIWADESAVRAADRIRPSKRR